MSDNKINVAGQYVHMPLAIQLSYSMPVYILGMLAVITAMLGVLNWADVQSLAEARGMGTVDHSIVLNQDLATQAYFVMSLVFAFGAFWAIRSTSATNRFCRLLAIAAVTGCVMFRYQYFG